MKLKAALLIAVLVSSSFSLMGIHMGKAEVGDQEWSKTFGGPGIDNGYSMIQTNDGGYAIVGFTNSSGAGGFDFLLVKTDSAGNQLWSKTYGGTGTENAYSVVQAADGGFAIAGLTNSFGAGSNDFWLVKTDLAGNQMWSKTYGGAGVDVGFSIILTSDGGYAIMGSSSSSGAGSNDYWLVKTDSIGNQLWNKTYGGAGLDSGYSLVQTGDGGFALAGYTNSFGAGLNDFWLVKTDPAGNQLWSRTYGDASVDNAFSLIQTNDGGYALAGYTNVTSGGSNFDYRLVKTDSAGYELWRKTYGGMGIDYGRSVIQTIDGGYTVAGYSNSSGAGSFDFWLIKTDSGGNSLWSRTYGGTSSDIGVSLVKTNDGGYAIAGSTSSASVKSDFLLVKVLGDTPTSPTLRVISADGDPTPAIGGLTYSPGTVITCSVSSPVTEGSTTWICTGWAGTGSVPHAGTGTNVDVILTQDSSIIWNWDSAPCSLFVDSSFGSPSPSVGSHVFSSGSSVTCGVNSPVVDGNLNWTCTGWIGTGSAPPSGESTSTTFTITEDSSVTWFWTSSYIQHTLIVKSDHGTSYPEAGTYSFDSGSTHTFSVISPVIDNDVNWTCIGWTGSGSIPPQGSETTVTFEVNEDSTITWEWTKSSVVCKLSFDSNYNLDIFIGERFYDYGSVVTGNVPEIIHDGNVNYTCVGWSANSGPIVPLGNETQISFKITSDTLITWEWVRTEKLSDTTVALIVASVFGAASAGIIGSARFQFRIKRPKTN